MQQQKWRRRLTAARFGVAPVVAGVILLTGPQGITQFELATPGAADGIFDDLRTAVPAQPGADGQTGTERPSQVPVPITGVIPGKLTIPTGVGGATTGIPGSVLPAYQKAAATLAATKPTCGMTWPLLAGIGKVESSHANGGRVDAAGNTRGPILGPVLDGVGTASIRDTDRGVLDGNAQWDRAVGPMQFIPGTWAMYAADGNGDGVKNPHNVYDAALAAANYLCTGTADLRTPRGLVEAVLRYNHSMDYVSVVLRWMQAYAQGAVTIPNETGVVPTATDRGNAERDVDPTHLPTNLPQDDPGRSQDDVRAAPQLGQTIISVPNKPTPPKTNDPTKPPKDVNTPPPPSSTPTTSPTKTTPPPATVSPTRPTPTKSTATPTDPTTDPNGNPSDPPSTPTPTPTPTPTETPTETPTQPQGCPTPTATPTDAPTATPTPDPSCAPSGTGDEGSGSGDNGTPAADPTGQPTQS